MPNYVSTLTGQQITSVMTQIDQGVPEGWAVGEKNGIPVSPSSPYYHNNAKYYAEQAGQAIQDGIAEASAEADRAEDAANRAEAAVPAGTAGAVFFDRAQTLTTAQQEQARQNIKAGGTNPNLLDNPWWGQGVVNQLGFTSYSGTSGGDIIMDRWIATYGSGGLTCSLTADGYSQAPLNASNRAIVQQKFEADTIAFLDGKTLTFSALLSDGTLAHGTITRANGTQQIFYNQILAGAAMRVGINASNVLFIESYTTGHTIKAVKLELGSVSTLANDTPPNYQQELAKSQRYFVRLSADTAYGMFGMGIVNNAGGTSAWVMLNLPVSMRRFPDTMTYSGSFRTLAGVNGALVTGTVSTMSISTNASNRNVARIDILGTGFGQFGTPFMLGANNDASAYIDISADL